MKKRKKKLLIFIVISILFSVVTGGALVYLKFERQSKMQSENAEFVSDFAIMINSLYDFRNNITKCNAKTEKGQYTCYYEMKEELDEVVRRMEIWQDNDNEKIKDVINEVNLIFDDYQEVVQGFRGMVKIKNNYDASAKTIVKYKSAVQRISMISLSFFVKEDDLKLSMEMSSQDKRRIDNYIKRLDWYKEISIERSNLESDSEFSAPEEYWALLMLRNSLEY